MKTVLAIAAALLASAATSSDDDPAHFKNADITFVTHIGQDPIPVSVGFTRLDHEKTITCRSINGCIIMFSAMVSGPSLSFFNICGFVDDSEATVEPLCTNVPQGNGFTYNSRQRAVVAQGTHTIQTKVNVFEDSTVQSWETDYTIYEKGGHAN